MKNQGKFIIVTGDKGGVGKSVMSTLITDYALSADHQRVILIEGDPQVNDVAVRFERGDKNLQIVEVDLASAEVGDSKAQDLSGLIEQMIEASEEPPVIILNAPASLSSTIDAAADDYREVAEFLGLELVAVWMAGRDESSAAMAGRSALVKAAHRRVAVLNVERPDQAAWRTGGMSDQWKAGGGVEFELMQMPGRLPEAMRNFSRVSYRDAVAGEAGEDGQSMRISLRLPLRRWIASADPICAKIMED